MKTIPPGSTIGVLGGGQLGRMLAMAAARLGYRCRIFAPEADPPAADVARHLRAAWDDLDALDEFAESVDVVTLEFENTPVSAAERMAGRRPARPSVEILAICQDRRSEKSFLERAGCGVAPWEAPESVEELARALARFEGEAILKTARLGYDGKGQQRLNAESDLEAAWAALAGAPAVLERRIALECELSVIVARAEDGGIRAYEPVRNRHEGGVLVETRAPAGVDGDLVDEAVALAEKIAEAIELIGVLAVEMFVDRRGRLMVNELAPRAHNSGHWTIDAAETSQFEQQVRAICGLPLGSTRRLAPARMINLLGGDAARWREHLRDPRARLHLYGKSEPRPGRKMGHVTIVEADAFTR